MKGDLQVTCLVTAKADIGSRELVAIVARDGTEVMHCQAWAQGRKEAAVRLLDSASADLDETPPGPVVVVLNGLRAPMQEFTQHAWLCKRG